MNKRCTTLLLIEAETLIRISCWGRGVICQGHRSVTLKIEGKVKRCIILDDERVQRQRSRKSNKKVHHSAKPSQRGYKRYRLRSPEEIKKTRKGTEVGSNYKRDVPRFLEVHDVVSVEVYSQ